MAAASSDAATVPSGDAAFHLTFETDLAKGGFRVVNRTGRYWGYVEGVLLFPNTGEKRHAFALAVHREHAPQWIADADADLLIRVASIMGESAKIRHHLKEYDKLPNCYLLNFGSATDYPVLLEDGTATTFSQWVGSIPDEILRVPVRVSVCVAEHTNINEGQGFAASKDVGFGIWAGAIRVLPAMTAEMLDSIKQRREMAPWPPAP